MTTPARPEVPGSDEVGKAKYAVAYVAKQRNRDQLLDGAIDSLRLAQHRATLASLASGDVIEAAANSEEVRAAFGRRKLSACPEVLVAVIRAAAPIFRAEAETRVGEVQRKLDRAHCVVVDLTADRDRMREENRILRANTSKSVLARLEAQGVLTPPPGGATR